MLSDFLQRFFLCAVILINCGASALADEAMPPEQDGSTTRWQAPPIEAQRDNPVRPNGPSVRRGARLFAGHCSTCHGDAGQGAGAQGRALQPADLARRVPRNSDGDLAWKIANGRGAMPAWKNQLKGQEIWDIVNYLRYMVGASAENPSALPRTRDGVTTSE